MVYSSKGYAHKALEYIIKALKITENEKDATSHVMAYHTIAKAYLNLDNPEQATRFPKTKLAMKPPPLATTKPEPSSPGTYG